MTKKESKYGNDMLMISTYLGKGNTFKMIPVTDTCPYSEVIYDPTTTLLVVISKIQKENFHMTARLDDDGNPIQAKKPKANGKTYKEKEVIMRTFQEYYIPEYKEQVAFLEAFGVNHSTFDWKKHLRDIDSEPALDLISKEKPAIVDMAGREI
tara:strand:+ start:6355 stop:6813 length:459 start_codon:yes stop_codon:yes gene_type:complete